MESYTIDLVGIDSRIIVIGSYTKDLVGIDSWYIDIGSYTIDLVGRDSVIIDNRYCRHHRHSPYFHSSNTLYVEHHTEKQLVPFLNQYPVFCYPIATLYCECM